jgi:RNA-binding protein YhbY
MVRPVKKLQIGKNGLTPEFIEQVKTIFTNEKVVKVSILKSACRDKVDAKKIADELVDALGKQYDYKLVGYVISIVKFRKEIRK